MLTGDTSGDLSFEFITDEGFRVSLEADYAELRSALSSGASKSALVLSGSIVEAVLVDYLQSTEQKKPDPLRMELAALIKACADAGVLTERTAELSSVIRSYRNLIHPGRVARLSESYGPEDAQVAAHVVRIIVREVAQRQAQEFGLTAEQVVTKFENDHNAPAIAELLLRDVRSQDIRRLLLTVLPGRYFDHLDGEWGPDQEVLVRLRTLYRAAHDAAPPAIQKQAAQRYVDELRESAGTRVEIYDEAFFRGSDLMHLTKPQRELVTRHLVARLGARALPPIELLRSIGGLAAYLNSGDFGKFIDGFVRVIAYDQHAPNRDAATDLLIDEYIQMSPEQDEQLRARLDQWAHLLEQRAQPDAEQRIRAIRTRIAIDDDIPF